MNIGFAQKKRKMKIGVWRGLRRRTRINVLTLNLLFYFMTVCCGDSFLFKWDEVVVFGQPNYTSNAFNAGLGYLQSLAVDPLDGSLWVGTQSLTNRSSLFTFCRNFSANFSSFVLQPSKSILIPNNPYVLSLLWLDSQTCLMGSKNNNANTSNLFVTRDHFTTTQQLPVEYNAFNDVIYGLGYSDVSNQVFVSKSTENQVRVLDNDGFFNKTLYVIGNAFNNNTLVSPPNASSLNTPYRIHQDCAGGFWVVDQGNCRVLHFKWNQTVADAVIGQPNFTTDCSSNLGIFSQTQPFGIAMNSDCSIMWISDTYRILRFRAPFNNTSQPEGVLGKPDFSSVSYYPPTASTFYGIYDILYDSKTKRLYLVDDGNNRVITGVTDEGSLRLAIIYNNVTINSAETLEINSSGTDQTLAIGGSLELKNGSLTRLNEGQVVLVARTITFGGMLTLVVNSSTQDQTVINVFNYSSSLNNSRFDQIVVIHNDGGRSECLSGTAQYEEKNMAVLVGISSKCVRSSSTGEADGGNSQTRTITIGVVVGVVGFCLLLCLGLGIILVVVVVVSKKRRDNRRVTAKF